MEAEKEKPEAENNTDGNDAGNETAEAENWVGSAVDG